MSAHAYTNDQLVEQPAIGLFAELGWLTMSALEDSFRSLACAGNATLAMIRDSTPPYGGPAATPCVLHLPRLRPQSEGSPTEAGRLSIIFYYLSDP